MCAFLSFPCTAPASGPQITEIKAISSRSIKVIWGAVPSIETNGNIIHYIVCYSTSSSDICSASAKKVVKANNSTTTLDDLNEFTTYFVGVKAATSAGPGEIGEIKNETTLPDSKYQLS